MAHLLDHLSTGFQLLAFGWMSRPGPKSAKRFRRNRFLHLIRFGSVRHNPRPTLAMPTGICPVTVRTLQALWCQMPLAARWRPSASVGLAFAPTIGEPTQSVNKPRSPLSFEEMEVVIRLTDAVDKVGEPSTPMFLTKLALLLSRELGNVDAVHCYQLRDLDLQEHSQLDGYAEADH